MRAKMGGYPVLGGYPVIFVVSQISSSSLPSSTIQPHNITMASNYTKTALTTHILDVSSQPSAGSLIKLHFRGQLEGPEALNIATSSHSVTRAATIPPKHLRLTVRQLVLTLCKGIQS